jgi:hypothetical protein
MLEGRASLEVKKLYIWHLRNSYKESLAQKHVLLDEISQTAGYHRKYALWVLEPCKGSAANLLALSSSPECSQKPKHTLFLV